MLIHRMTAAFGKLQDSTIALNSGLNIIEAPNESGKSTWCAFLLAMLYGINSRERDRAGYIAAKNRYAPWTGTFMSGTLDCTALEQKITLNRSTSVRDRPMSEFHAVFTGTSENVPELTGRNCGETLLGVTRDVYERSAFIRQSGLPIGQSAELERRIASLITSGEEDTSYAEASETLRRQLNRRRHNKSGQIPALEQELQATRRQIDRADHLEAKLASAQERLDTLEQREEALNEELRSMDRWEAVRSREALAGAQDMAAEAEEYAAGLRQEMDERNIPGLDTISRLRGAIVNLRSVRTQVERAESEEEEARQALRRAESAVRKSAFAGRSPEVAEHLPLDLPPRPEIPFVLKICLGICIGAPLTAFVLHPGAFLMFLYGLCVILGLGTLWMIRQREKSWDELHDRRQERREEELEQYRLIYSAMLDARTEVSAKASAAEALRHSFVANEETVLREVHVFAPEAATLEKADETLREFALQWKELSAAEASARETGLRRDFLEQNQPGNHFVQDGASASAPVRAREETLQDLASLREDVFVVRSEVDRLTGQLRSIGDAVVLRSAAARSQEELNTLEQEYAAIQLAMNSLNRANAALHTRFSPALGRRAAEIFRLLTENRYTDVALDRDLHISASSGDAYRNILSLSEGAADQLYLAVRLAISELILPAEYAAPVILDDALANFDDARCAAALRFLRTFARSRQILLFTCHSREADFFSRDPDVSILRLTKDGNMI